MQLRACEPVPSLVFIIEKRRIARQLVVEILTPTLKRTVREILGRTDISGSSLVLDVEALLVQYEAFRRQSALLGQRSPNGPDTRELNLLLQGCLLDHALYYGVYMSPLQSRFKGSWNKTCIQDILHRRLVLGLDELDDCFRLGLLTEQAAALEIGVFNHRFEQLAYAGDLYALQEHIEPAVRSGEVEVQHDTAFLANILGRGHRVTHQYLVDLSQRTLTSNPHFARSDDRDVSGHPMYKAICSGQLDQVRVHVMNRHHFSGYLCQTHDGSTSYVTPLITAVHWENVALVRMLLDAGAPYLEGWTDALSWATVCNLEEITHILLDYGKSLRNDAQHLVPAPFPSFGSTSMSTYLEVPKWQPRASPHMSHDPSRSVSEIANKMAGLRWDEGVRRFDQLSVFSSGTSTPTPGTSSWASEGKASDLPPSPFSAYHIVQPSSAQNYRLRLGKDLVSRLESHCERLRSGLANGDWASHALVSSFSSARRVWQCGIGCARRLLQNQSSGFTAAEAVQLLLVADVLDPNAMDGCCRPGTRYVFLE